MGLLFEMFNVDSMGNNIGHISDLYSFFTTKLYCKICLGVEDYFGAWP